MRDQVEFPFTHDLAALSLLLAEPVVEVRREELVDLSKLAADSRYPGDAPQPVRADAEAAVAVARAVLADATRKFGEG